MHELLDQEKSHLKQFGLFANFVRTLRGGIQNKGSIFSSSTFA